MANFHIVIAVDKLTYYNKEWTHIGTFSTNAESNKILKTPWEERGDAEELPWIQLFLIMLEVSRVWKAGDLLSGKPSSQNLRHFHITNIFMSQVLQSKLKVICDSPHMYGFEIMGQGMNIAVPSPEHFVFSFSLFFTAGKLPL